MQNDMRDRLIELISQIQYMGGLESRLAEHLLANGVMLPLMNIGDMIFFLIEDDIPVHKWYLSEEKVTEVCSKGFFTNEFLPAEEDFSNYTPYDEIGKTVFLTKAEAEQALSERKDKM